MKNENFKSTQRAKIIIAKIAKVICTMLMAVVSLVIAVATRGSYFDSYGNYVEREPSFGIATLLTLLGYWVVKKIFNPIIRKNETVQEKSIIEQKTKTTSYKFNKFLKIGFIFFSIHATYSLLFTSADIVDTETTIINIVILLFSIVSIVLISQIIKLNSQLEGTKDKIVFRKNLIYTIIITVINPVLWVPLLMIPQYSFLLKTKKILQPEEPIVGQTEDNVIKTHDKNQDVELTCITQIANVFNKNRNKNILIIAIAICMICLIVFCVRNFANNSNTFEVDENIEEIVVPEKIIETPKNVERTDTITDENGNIEIKKYIDDEWQRTYEYDNKSNLIGESSKGGFRYRYKYDNNGNKTEEYRYSGWKLSSKYTYKYDNRNNLIEECEYKATSELKSMQTYKYNSNGKRIESRYFYISYNDASMEVRKYDSDGYVIEEYEERISKSNFKRYGLDRMHTISHE